jgi:HlyD family secretion protein
MIARIRTFLIHRKLTVVLTLVLSCVGVLGAVRYTNRSPTLPTFQVKRGEFVDSLQFRGQVKALKSLSIVAPDEAGDLKILKIVEDGSQVRPGDMIVEFDKTKTEQELARDRSALKSAEAEIEQAKAEARLVEEGNLTAVAKARFDVEAAKLDASKQEILSRIDGAEANLKVSDASHELHQMEEKLKSGRATHKATIDSRSQASKKAAYDVQRAEQALTKMILRSPAAGTISLVSISHLEGQAPFKVGDTVWSGAPIAEVPDTSALRLSMRVDETERGRLALTQPVTVQLDAIPDQQFTGNIERISTIASSDYSGGWPFPRNFDLQVTLNQSDPRLRPGMSAQVTIIVDRVANAVTIPMQASFQKSGESVAYRWTGSKFEEQTIEIGRRSGDRVLVSRGLREGDRVALKDPFGKE